MKLYGRKIGEVNSVYPCLYVRHQSRMCMDLRDSGDNSNVIVRDRTGRVIKELTPEGKEIINA